VVNGDIDVMRGATRFWPSPATVTSYVAGPAPVCGFQTDSVI
jgi:hypothetical protein